MGKIAFVFSGQGAQRVGMGADLYESVLASRKIYDLLDDSLKQLMFEGSQEELNSTIHAQPCLFAHDLAAAAALHERGIYAEGCAGFSLGEIPALAHCGMLSLSDAYQLVSFRANALHTCSLNQNGGMYAVLGMNSQQVDLLCSELLGIYPANYNCPTQTVVSTIEKYEDSLKEAVSAKGKKLIKLATSGAFHSSYMDEAANEMEMYLQSVTFLTANIPLYSNVTAYPYDAKLHDSGMLSSSCPISLSAGYTKQQLLSLQINHPVLWQSTIEHMIADQFDTFIEVGPGNTLSGLIKKINKTVSVFSVSDMETLEQTVRSIGGHHA